jgi:hypothetical protein
VCDRVWRKDGARASTLPERLVKRGKDLDVEVENFANVIRSLMFVNVDIDGIAFSPTEELDVGTRDAVHVRCDSRAFT